MIYAEEPETFAAEHETFATASVRTYPSGEALFLYAQGVAAALTELRGCAWHARRAPRNGHLAEILRFDGAGVLVRPDTRNASRGRLFLRAEFPVGHDPWDHEKRVHVAFAATASIERPAAQTARHMVRTFLHRYEAAWVVASKKVAEEKRKAEEDAAFLDALVDLGARRGALKENTYIAGLRVKPTYNGLVEVNGRIPRDVFCASPWS